MVSIGSLFNKIVILPVNNDDLEGQHIGVLTYLCFLSMLSWAMQAVPTLGTSTCNPASSCMVKRQMLSCVALARAVEDSLLQPILGGERVAW